MMGLQAASYPLEKACEAKAEDIDGCLSTVLDELQQVLSGLEKVASSS